MKSWGSGAWLVFARGLWDNLRSRSFKVVLGVMLAASAASIVLPKVLMDDVTVYTLATVGVQTSDVRTALDAAGEAGGFEVEYISRDNGDDVRAAVARGDATVGIAGDTLYTAAEDAGTLPAVVAQALVSRETARALADARLTTEQAASLRDVRPPEQVTVGAVRDEGRAGVGFAVGAVLNLALLLAGTAIATTVALEKSTRISEVLLAVVKPSQILVGTVLAVGAVALIQLLALAVPIVIALQVYDDLGLPAVAAGDIVLAAVWFLLGFGVYALLFAAGGALADKITEVDVAVRPVSMTVFGAYFISILIVMEDPQGPWSVLASMFPLTAPLAMPLRWAGGEVATWQLLLAMALTAATAVAVVYLASAVYRRALLITGHRVRVRELLAETVPTTAP